MNNPIRKALQRMVFGPTSNTRWLFLTPGQRKYWRKVGDGSASSAVMAPLLWIGKNFPEAPPALWLKETDSGEEERVIGEGYFGGDHPLIELLERPTPYYSGAILWMATLMDWHLSGNAYWLKIRDTGGRPTELWWTPSGLIKPNGDENTFIKNYLYNPPSKGEPIEIDTDDVVHFRYGMDADDPRKGKSPLSSLLQEIFTDQEASDFTSALLSNMGVPGLVISPSSTGPNVEGPSPDDVKATKDYMREGFSGDRRGEPLVMSGPTTVEQFGFSPEQLTLRELRRIPEERVTACTGVPAIVAGLGAGLDRSTFANFAEAREAAYQDCIIPSQRIISEEVRFQLLPDFEPDTFRAYRFGFDLSGVRVLQEDQSDLATRLNVGIQGGWVRVSEGRRALDLEVDDSDEIYLRGVNIIEIPAGESMAVVGNANELSPGNNPPQLGPGNTDNEPQEQLEGEANPTQQSRLRNGHSKQGDMQRFLPVRVKARRQTLSRFYSYYLSAWNRNHYVLSTTYQRELHTAFTNFGKSCAEEYLRRENTGKSLARGGVLVRQKIDASTLVEMIVNELLGNFSNDLSKLQKTHVLRTMDQTINTVNMVTALSMGVPDTVEKQILEAGGKRLGLIDVEKQTRNSIFNVINEGNQAGSGPDVIARSIRSQVSAGPFPNAGASYRSRLIARTETNWAANTSALAAYRDSDVVSGVMALDGEGDPECAARDGEHYSFDEADAQLNSEHPNGTLCFAPDVDGCDFTKSLKGVSCPVPTAPPIKPEKFQEADLPSTILSESIKDKSEELVVRKFADQRLEQTEAKAIRVYTGLNDYTEINGSLRGALDRPAPTAFLSYGSELDRSFSLGDAVKNLDNAINDTETKEEMVVYRGMATVPGEPSDVFHMMEPGDEFTDHGYVSTSLLRGVAERMAGTYPGEPLVLQVNLPARTHAVSALDPYSLVNNGYEGEQEVILPRDSKFRVIAKQPDGDLEVEWIGIGEEGSVPRTEESAAKQKDSPDSRASRFVWQEGDIVIDKKKGK